MATFGDGSLEQSITIDGTGKGVLSLSASSSNVFADARQRRFDYWKDKVSSPYMLVAYAAEGECNPIDETSLDSFGEAIHMGAEYSRFMADCEYLPKLKKAFIELQTSEGVTEKLVAVAELGFYSVQYYNAKKAQLALVLGPQCLEGAITGNVENFASATCDIITSFFLIGDLRDFALHSKYQYWDNDQSKFDYPVYVFSGLGIAASLASLGGVGIPANAAIAGMKAGAKVMDGPFMTAMAKHLNDEIGGDFLNFDRIRTTLNVTLPILQVTAAGVLYRTEFAAAYDAISSIRADQILGVMKYTKVALQQLASEYVAYNEYPEYQDAFGLQVAYAIDKDGIIKLLGGNDDAAAAGIKKLVRLMHETQEKVDALNLPGAKNGPTSYIKDLFVGGISKFGDDIDTISNQQLIEIVANDKLLTALVIAQDMGKAAGRTEAEMIEAIRRFRCLSGPGECSMGGVVQGKEGMIEFFGFFERVAAAQQAGKISDEAWGSLSKVISAMGPKLNNTSDVSRIKGTAKGATSNFAEIALKLEEDSVKLVAAEKKVPSPLGSHQFDHILEISGAARKREIKEWKDEEIDKYLWWSLSGKYVNQKGEDVAAGQLYLDITELFQKGAHEDLARVDIDWAFVNGDPSKIVDDLVARIETDSSKLKAIIKASDNEALQALLEAGNKELLRNFIQGDLTAMLEKLVMNTKSI